jgi:enoyl-CoA hydratase
MDDGKVNALSNQMLGELDAALDRAAADGAVVLLAGRPGVFSAGFDLSTLGSGGTEAFAMVRAGFELAARLLSFPTPVIVACTGHAVAMGLFVVLSADYRVGAAGPYKLQANEVAIGITLPGAAIEILRQRLSAAHFTRAALLAEPYTPDTAVEAGILDRVVPAAELMDAARASAEHAAALDLDAHAASKQRARGATVEAIRAAIDIDAQALRLPA